MARKVSLPLRPDLPTIDAVRKKLGGRAIGEPGRAGEIVRVRTASGDVVGCVVFASGDDVDVWVSENKIRRAKRDALTSEDETRAPVELRALAADARAFAELVVGERVRYQHDEGVGEGALVEKCRFGGLVERDDGVIVGAAFRRVWRASSGEPN